MFLLDAGFLNYEIQGKRLYPRAFSEADFQKRLARLLVQEHCLYILPSVGLAYGLSAILHNVLPAQSIIIIFENDGDPFSQLQCSGQESSENSTRRQVSILAQGNRQLAGKISEQWEYWQNLRQNLLEQEAVYFCSHSRLDDRLAWMDLHLQLSVITKGIKKVQVLQFLRAEPNKTLNLLATQVEGLVQNFWRNRSTSMFMSHLWIKNACANLLGRYNSCSNLSPSIHLTEIDNWLELNQPSAKPRRVAHISQFENKSLEKCIMLCGAGCELDSYFPALKEYQNKGARIAVVDTALASLIEFGIIPNIVIQLEGQFANLDDFIASSSHKYLGTSLLIYDIFSLPASLRFFKHRSVFFSRFAPIRFLDIFSDSLPVCPALGSVGPTSLYILLQYSNADLYFCGFDFAYPRGQSHARSSSHHQRVLRESSRLEPTSHWALETANDRRCELRGRPALDNPVLASYSARFTEILNVQGRGTTANFQNRVSSISQSTSISALKNIHQDIENLGQEIYQFLESNDNSNWDTIVGLLNKQDFLWRFFPQPLEPSSDSKFLIPLSKSLNYWLNYFDRLFEKVEDAFN